MMKRFYSVLLWVFACCAHAAESGIGVIITHGKWGSPEQHVAELAAGLQKSGYLVATPDMPWSRRRNYDKGVEDADAQIDAEIAKLKERGASQVVLIGHSLGAAHALHYAGRSPVDGIVALAPGHRPEAPRFARQYADDLKRARELVAAGKNSEAVTFTDLNTGNRRARTTASAAAFVSYFDPAGPLNMGRNVAEIKASTPVLWIEPTREEQPLRDGLMALYRKLPANPRTRLAEPESGHLDAPAASVGVVVQWLRTLSTP
jgi:pimeloyl-ACP methyl ester carboxylesterase